MRKVASLAPVLALLLAPVAIADGVPGPGPFPRTILGFGTMYGVDGPFVGDANPVRGVVGDEAPWEVGSVAGKLDTQGRLTIVVRGLVFKDDPRAPEGFVGKNDEPTFRGLVSCLTEEGNQTPVRNVTTKEFPATITGNSFIHDKIELPNPCVAPIVMILAGSEDKWFAMTGFESEEDQAVRR